MAPFRAKIGGKRIREGEKRNYRFIPFLSGAEQKMPKKKAKKLTKLKNTIMASFQGKIVWKHQEREKLKIMVSFSSQLTRYRKFQKNGKKFKNQKKIPLWHHFKPKSVERGGEREKIKIIILFRSYLTRYRKFQKNSKNKKNTIMASFQAKIG